MRWARFVLVAAAAFGLGAALAAGAMAAPGLELSTAGKGVLLPGQPLQFEYSVSFDGTLCGSEDEELHLLTNGQKKDEVEGDGNTIGGACSEEEYGKVIDFPWQLSSKGAVKGPEFTFRIPTETGLCEYIATKSVGEFSLGSLASDDTLEGTAKLKKSQEKTCQKKFPFHVTYSLFTGEDAPEEPVMLG
jgi:hypothetical protein